MLTYEEDLHFYNLLASKLGDDAIGNGFKLLFRASEHRYKASAFHKFCDGHAPTLTIIESNFGNIFGGFTSIEWTPKNQWRSDKKAFLFLIRSVDEKQNCPKAFDLNNIDLGNPGDHRRAIVHSKPHGPIFGSSIHDIFIRDKCNVKNGSCGCFTSRSSYNHNNELCGGECLDEIGTMDFTVEEYEVVKLM